MPTFIVNNFAMPIKVIKEESRNTTLSSRSISDMHGYGKTQEDDGFMSFVMNNSKLTKTKTNIGPNPFQQFAL